jgi:predicted DNA-binding transcriptional regulator AlpA
MHNTEALLRLPEVLKIFPISRAGWYEGVRTGRYPKPVRLGLRAVAWRRSDVAALIENLPETDDVR